jgi:hypothetical protein
MEAIKEILSSPSKWTLAPRENDYSCDQVIDAYLKGKSDGIQQTRKFVTRQLDRNVSKTVEQTYRLVEHLSGLGFHPLAAYVKIDDWDTFAILMPVPDEEWCEMRFLDVFDYVIKTEQCASGEFYSLEIQLFGIPDMQSLNEQSVFADGYILKLNIA